jgi:hypothetical protein
MPSPQQHPASSQLQLTADLNPNWHTLTIDRTLSQLETGDRTGLTERQIIDFPKERLRQRQQKFGANELVATASRQ